MVDDLDDHEILDVYKQILSRGHGEESDKSIQSCKKKAYIYIYIYIKLDLIKHDLFRLHSK